MKLSKEVVDKYIRPNGVVKYNILAGDLELLSYLIKKLTKARSR